MGRTEDDEPMVSVPLSVARLIDRAFLPTNPNRMRGAAAGVRDAAHAFRAALLEVEAGGLGFGRRLFEEERARQSAEADEVPLEGQLMQDLLSLVLHPEPPPLAEISTWTEDQRRSAEAWAGALHLYASDNEDVEVPEMPAFLAPWRVR